MNKFIKQLVIACVLHIIGTTAVVAQTQLTTQIQLTKKEVKAIAVEVCQAEAKKRFGQDSIKHIGNKAKWMNGMGGASVKIKVKPQSKRVTKYSCVLQRDKLVKFYKV